METDFLDYIYTNLKVISRIEENGKVCIRNGNLHLEMHGYLQLFTRWLNNDNRDSTLGFIKNIISCCISASKNIILCGLSQQSREASSSADTYEQAETSSTPVRDGGQRISTIHKSQITTLLRIKNSLLASKKGLVNFKVTYKDDITIQSSIDVTLEKIDMHIIEIEDYMDFEARPFIFPPADNEVMPEPKWSQQ